MALIRKLEETKLSRNTVHEEVSCTVTRFQSGDGDPYLQIDTYGSEDRQLKGKKSQSIQIDRGAAVELHRLLRETFSL